MNALPRLYAVADGTFGDPVRRASELIEGGARLIQIRHKTASSQTLMEIVDEVLKVIPPDALIIVNDRPDVAKLANAAGSHLGQEDLSPSLARVVLGPNAIVGLSTHNMAQAVAADGEPVDYIAAGPVFPTTTKHDAAPVLGLKGLREICSRVHKPVVAIGGVTIENAHEVFRCGVASVAVVSDLFRSGNVVDRTRSWIRHLES